MQAMIAKFLLIMHEKSQSSTEGPDTWKKTNVTLNLRKDRNQKTRSLTLVPEKDHAVIFFLWNLFKSLYAQKLSWIVIMDLLVTSHG